MTRLLKGFEKNLFSAPARLLLANLMTEDDKAIFVARLLILAIVISMTRAFALVSLLELALCLLFVCNSKLRSVFTGALSDIRVSLTMLFWVWVFVATLWGDASLAERFEEWWSWRKLILVPMVFGLFATDSSKRCLLWALVGICTLFMIGSWGGYFGVIELDREPSKLLENHATQGILFGASALFLCGLLIQGVSIKTFLGKSVAILLIIGFVSNIMLILTGRSGYSFLLVTSTVFFFLVLKLPALHRLGAAAALFITISAGFFFSETANERVRAAIHNIEHAFDASSINTSLGMRTVMWVNTVYVIDNHFPFGTGSGSFKNAYAEVVKSESGWRSQVSDDPHQQYLHIAAEQGIPGLIIFLGALGAWLFTVRLSSNVYHYLGIAILMGTAVNGFANGHFGTFVEGRLVWIYVAGLLSGTSAWIFVMPSFLRNTIVSKSR